MQQYYINDAPYGCQATNNPRNLLATPTRPQSSGDIDPEADSELKKPPDPSEVSIFRIFRKLHISVRTKIYQEISRNDPESRTLNPKPFY